MPNPSPAGSPPSATLAQAILHILEDHKANDPLILNISRTSSFTDFLVIASGTSSRHVGALGDAVQEAFTHENLSTEGLQGSEWVVIDLGSVVVHLFTPEKRSLYNLEKLWSYPPSA